VIFYHMVDRLARSVSERLEAGGETVIRIDRYSDLCNLQSADNEVFVNYSCGGKLGYMFATLLGALLARVEGKIVYLYFSVDEIDLLESRAKQTLLYPINFAIVQLATVLLLMKSRDHYRPRYFVQSKPFHYFESCPDPSAWRKDIPESTSLRDPNEPLHFFYHGSFLWWHGLDRFFPVLEEIRKHRKVRLTLVGNFDPSGMKMDPRGKEFAEAIRRRLDEPGVEYLGKVSQEELNDLMARADFHVTHFDSRSMQGNTELRTGLLEAMAAGMACLHCPTEGLRSYSVFNDGENIILIDPDKPEMSAQKILALADDPDKLSHIRQNARNTIQDHFSFDELLARFHTLRNELNERRTDHLPGPFSNVAAALLRHLGRFLAAIK